MKNERKIVKEAKGVVSDLLKKLEVRAKLKVSLDTYKDSEGEKVEFLNVEITGEDLGSLIGYLGRNLRAIQRLVGMIINKKFKEMDDKAEYLRVVVDVEGYRDGRVEHLEKFALQVREEVLERGEPVDMPRMAAYERRVIHIALSEHKDVKTESFGEGRERHVRVSPVSK